MSPTLELPLGSVAYLTATAPYLALAAAVLSVLAIILILFLSIRVHRISIGKHGSLEDTLSRLARDVHELQGFRGELELYLKHAETRLRSTLRGVGVVRFNAFSQNAAGGNQSFAIALLDEKLSGVVFSTLYARDRVGVYAKPIENGTSTFTLTEEEEEAVEKARAHLSQKRPSEK